MRALALAVVATAGSAHPHGDGLSGVLRCEISAGAQHDIAVLSAPAGGAATLFWWGGEATLPPMTDTPGMRGFAADGIAVYLADGGAVTVAFPQADGPRAVWRGVCTP